MAKAKNLFKQATKMYKTANKMYQSQVKGYNNITLSQIDRMTGEQFEYFLADLCQRMGYAVRTTPVTGDYGADLLLFSGTSHITVVQAKRYKGNVGVTAVQEVVSAKAVYHASEAMVITNAEFTKAAQNLALANRVRLVGRLELAKLIRQYMG